MFSGGCDCAREWAHVGGACRGGAPLPRFIAGLLGFSGFEGADGLAVCSGFAADGVFDPGG